MNGLNVHIAHYEGVQGGAAVVAGTRTPVRTIVAKFRTYEGDISEVLRSFPHLNEAELRAALTYYEQNRAEIDSDTERHQHALHSLGASIAS